MICLAQCYFVAVDIVDVLLSESEAHFCQMKKKKTTKISSNPNNSSEYFTYDRYDSHVATQIFPGDLHLRKNQQYS